MFSAITTLVDILATFAKHKLTIYLISNLFISGYKMKLKVAYLKFTI